MHAALFCLEAAVAHLGFYGDGGVWLFNVGIYEGAKGRHADGSGLHQPCITVDTCTLVEPSLLESGVSAHADEIVAAVVHIFRHIVHLSGIAAGLGAHVEAVEPHAGVAEDAVELQHDALAKVFLGDIDGLAIPSHTSSRSR